MSDQMSVRLRSGDICADTHAFDGELEGFTSRNRIAGWITAPPRITKCHNIIAPLLASCPHVFNAEPHLSVSAYSHDKTHIHSLSLAPCSGTINWYVARNLSDIL